MVTAACLQRHTRKEPYLTTRQPEEDETMCDADNPTSIWHYLPPGSQRHRPPNGQTRALQGSKPTIHQSLFPHTLACHLSLHTWSCPSSKEKYTDLGDLLPEGLADTFPSSGPKRECQRGWQRPLSGSKREKQLCKACQHCNDVTAEISTNIPAQGSYTWKPLTWPLNLHLFETLYFRSLNDSTKNEW